MHLHRHVRRSTLVALLSIVVAAGCRTSTPSARDYLEDARTAMEAKRWTEARALAELAADQNSRSRDVRRFRARLERAAGERAKSDGSYEKAFRHFRDAAKLEPSRSQRASDWVASVEAGRRQGLSPDELAPMAQRAVDANPSLHKARQLAAGLWDDAGEPKSALDSYLWLWQADRSNVSVGTRLGAIYRSLDRLDDAAAVFQRVLEADGDNVRAALQLAAIQAERGAPGKARRIYERLREDYPDNPSIMMRYAAFLRRQGDEKRARELQRRAQEKLPGVERREMRELE